jgi:hypothetical protein
MAAIRVLCASASSARRQRSRSEASALFRGPLRSSALYGLTMPAAMPELPEVETVCGVMRQALQGKRKCEWPPSTLSASRVRQDTLRSCRGTAAHRDGSAVAGDPTLDPPPSAPGSVGLQTGAWILADSSPLPSELEEFLGVGEPPVYFGFGSMPVGDGTSRTLIEAARTAGRRAIMSQGWGGLALIDQAADCIAIEDTSSLANWSKQPKRD